MENAFLRWWGCGAFSVILGDVNIALDLYLFNENLEGAEPIYDYIFISHEHFDHCHPPCRNCVVEIASRKSLLVPVASPLRSRLIKRMGTPPLSGIFQSPSICRRKRFRCLGFYRMDS